MTGPTWTILVATLGQRRELLRHLLDGLMPQVDAAGGAVKVLAYWDNGEADVSAKKQALLEAADTDYVSFVDDDDTVSDDYVPAILEAMASRPDYVGLKMQVYYDGRPWMMSHHSLRHAGWINSGETYYRRDITTSNPMRTAIAQTARFTAGRGEAEDIAWATQLRDGGLLKSEVFIDRVLYHYWWSPTGSTWQLPDTRAFPTAPGGQPWRPLTVASPNFSWHPASDLPDATTADILIIVPARTRTWNIERLIGAWGDTGAWGTADLRVDIDADDPNHDDYLKIDLPRGARIYTWDTWRPCMHKLEMAVQQELNSYFALGFMGDDHVPRTNGWAQRWLEVLHELGTGIVYGADGYQDEELPTQWAMTTNIVRAFGRMVPSQVEHLFSDTAVGALGKAGKCIRYLPDTLIEHMHYSPGKAPMDAQYERFNSRWQWMRDEAAYKRWKHNELAEDLVILRDLMRTGERRG